MPTTWCVYEFRHVNYRNCCVRRYDKNIFDLGVVSAMEKCVPSTFLICNHIYNHMQYNVNARTLVAIHY